MSEWSEITISVKPDPAVKINPDEIKYMGVTYIRKDSVVPPATKTLFLAKAIEKASHPGHRMKMMMHPEDWGYFEAIVSAASAYLYLVKSITKKEKES
jgi:hypothetical protein